jgi:hypothetical protein
VSEIELTGGPQELPAGPDYMQPDPNPDVDLEELQRQFEKAEAEASPQFPFPPPNGWQPQDFPQVTFAFIPYTSQAMPRADPFMTVTPDGWLYVEAGNVRMAIPDLEEWEKFAYMVTCLWNAYRLNQMQAATPEGEDDDGSSTDQGSLDGQDALADHGEPGPRDEVGAPLPSDPESG